MAKKTDRQVRKGLIEKGVDPDTCEVVDEIPAQPDKGDGGVIEIEPKWPVQWVHGRLLPEEQKP